MKYTSEILLLISLIISLSCSPRKIMLFGEIEDLHGKEMHGKVKSISTIQYRAIDVLDPDELDDNGWPIDDGVGGENEKIREYSMDKIYLEKLIFNKKGKPEFKEIVSWWLGDTLVFTYNYAYDDNYNLIKEEIVTLNEKGEKSTEKFWFEYNGRNELTQEFYSETNERKLRKEYYYDEKGNNVKISHNNGEDETLYFYDKRNLLLEKRSVYGAQIGYRERYKYFPNKLVSEMEIVDDLRYDDTEIADSRIYKYKYDATGNVIEIVVSPGKDYSSIRTIDYEYDRYKNWVSKREFVDGELSEIVEREISYY